MPDGCDCGGGRLFGRFVLLYRRRFSAFRHHPLLVQSFQHLLLCPNREIRIVRVFLPISPLNEGDGVVGDANFCVDLLTRLLSPPGPGLDHRRSRDNCRRGKLDFSLRRWWRFFAFGPGPLLVESCEELLLRPNREVRIVRVPPPISLLNECN